jgi:CRISPR system Cascade subunit CasA
MNVAFNPWIPVVTLLGERKLVSLEEVLTKGSRHADLAVRPHERVSLMRLFLCVVHAALDGPKDIKEWREVPKRFPEAAKSYLDEWKDSFELFHKEKPWLQVAELNVVSEKKKRGGDGEDWSPLSRLCFERASGINTTLFDHASNGGPPTEYTPEEIALNLLTFQNFFVAGGQAPHNTAWGEVKMTKPPYPSGGPCAGKSILFTFLRGKNLEETIHLNLSTHNDLKTIYGDSSEWLGQPLWEKPIKSPDDKEAIDNATRTHLGRLVPQTRMLRINEDCRSVLIGPGFIYPKFQDEKNPFDPDQFATLVATKDQKRILLSARLDIAVWRELHSLLVRKKDADGTSTRGPLCLRNIQDNADCDIVVNALLTNPKQAAEIVDLLESVFHIPSKLLQPQGTITYEIEVRNASIVAHHLGDAIKKYRKGSGDKSEKSSNYTLALTHYWTTIEKNLSLLFHHAGTLGTPAFDPKAPAWRKKLIAIGRESYELACSQETPRQLKAFAEGSRELVLSEKFFETNHKKAKEKSS